MADSIKVKLLDAQKNPILPETSADQVTMADGGNVETKIKALEGAVSGKVPCYVVNDIAARDGLESPKQGDLCWVKDATADATVSTGAAQYIYDGSAWVKIAEAEAWILWSTGPTSRARKPLKRLWARPTSTPMLTCSTVSPPAATP